MDLQEETFLLLISKKYISRLYRFVKNKIKLELPKSSVVNLSFDGLTEGHKHFIGSYATYYIEELDIAPDKWIQRDVLLGLRYYLYIYIFYFHFIYLDIYPQEQIKVHIIIIFIYYSCVKNMEYFQSNF